MLDDDKKRQIEAEERHRRDVAKKLDTDLAATVTDIKNLKNDLWSKVSETLNSNFGLWLLSSVFLSGGAALYQITQHHYEAKLETQKQLATCEFEIANRLNSMKFLLARAKTVGEAQFALTPVTKSLGAISVEYDNANIAVLYFKIYQLTGQKDMAIVDYVRQLEEGNLAIQRQNPKDVLAEDDRKKMLAIIDVLHRYAIKEINEPKK
jgi:hypothetical protein